MVSIAQFTQFSVDSHLENFETTKATFNPIGIGLFHKSERINYI